MHKPNPTITTVSPSQYHLFLSNLNQTPPSQLLEEEDDARKATVLGFRHRCYSISTPISHPSLIKTAAATIFQQPRSPPLITPSSLKSPPSSAQTTLNSKP
ncbi:hypothetical protein Hanom_Chr05g00473401 [Helianthus anomalus]